MAHRATGSYSAQTENDIALTFTVTDATELRLGDQLEVDLVSVVTSRVVIRKRDGAIVHIALGDHDIHDLRLPIQHGGSRRPTLARLRGDE